MAKSSKKSNSGKIGIEVLIRIIGAILCVVAFCMMFTEQLKVEGTIPLLGTVSTKYGFQDVLFGSDSLTGATWAFIGYLLILVGGILVPVLSFIGLKNKNISMILGLLGVACVIAGAVLVFCVGGMWSSLNSIDSKYIYLLFGPIFAGILAILAAVIDVCAPFIAKLIKK